MTQMPRWRRPWQGRGPAGEGPLRVSRPGRRSPAPASSVASLPGALPSILVVRRRVLAVLNPSFGSVRNFVDGPNALDHRARGVGDNGGDLRTLPAQSANLVPHHDAALGRGQDDPADNHATEVGRGFDAPVAEDGGSAADGRNAPLTEKGA